MVVVSDTSPLSNLAIIGRLHLLRAQYHEIWIPNAVRDELDRLPHGRAAADIRKVQDDGWIKQRAITDARVARIIGVNLDKGESEAIALAVELSADLVLLDETDGRRAAERAGLRVTGVLGILLRAKTDGTIPAVKPELEALRVRARFFVSGEMERRFLASASEST